MGMRDVGYGVMLSLLAASPAAGQSVGELETQVREAERAFARSMADRDLTAFTAHLADDAVFIGASALRGKAAIVEGWRRFFDGPQAPFSWEPETVAVLESGSLALSTGPVRDPSGTRVGTYNSVWRRGADGRWRIVLDKGCPACDCGKSP